MLFFSACRDNPDDEPTSETAAFELSFLGQYDEFRFFYDTRYAVPNSTDTVEFTNVQFVISELRLVAEDGSEILLQDSMGRDFFMVDFQQGHDLLGKTQHAEGTYLYIDDVPPGRYQGVRFNIGVPAALNDGNGGLYTTDRDHPLSPWSGMAWNMLNGYIFVKAEGIADTNGAGTHDVVFAYHLGGNSNFKALDFTGPGYAFELQPGYETQFPLDVYLDELFFDGLAATVDIASEPAVHDPNPTAGKMMNQLVQGIRMVRPIQNVPKP